MKQTVKNLADELGLIKAQIAELEEKQKTVRALLIASGESAVEGDLFRASITEAARKEVNWKAIAEKLEPSRQLVQAHTRLNHFPVIRVSSRNAA